MADPVTMSIRSIRSIRTSQFVVTERGARVHLERPDSGLVPGVTFCGVTVAGPIDACDVVRRWPPCLRCVLAARLR